VFQRSFVRKVLRSLRARRDFKLKKISTGEFDLASSVSRIRFIFERHGGGLLIYVATPDPADRGMHMLLLRHLVGAREVRRFGTRPQKLAAILNKYFSELLNGDFSIRARYDEVGLNFFSLLMEANRLPDRDPIRVKIKNFDISWMEDFAARNRSDVETKYFLVGPGPRPPFYELPKHLWGPNCDYDSDGNSSEKDASDWTELYAALRPECKEVVVVSQVAASPLVLCISSKDQSLALKAATFLKKRSGGELRDRWA